LWSFRCCVMLTPTKAKTRRRCLQSQEKKPLAALKSHRPCTTSFHFSLCISMLLMKPQSKMHRISSQVCYYLNIFNDFRNLITVLKPSFNIPRIYMINHGEIEKAKTLTLSGWSSSSPNLTRETQTRRELSWGKAIRG
jgi:hypothetical protein